MDQCDSNLVPQSSVYQETDQMPRGLFVKFKIPNTSFRDDGQNHNLNVSDHGGHPCHFCGKRFSSGKALGGHIRVHMIKTGRGKKKTQSYLCPKLEDKAEGKREVELKVRSLSGGEGKTNTVKCYLCSKEFRSMKSLFGHMRNHPERGWRGIRPPGDDKNNRSCSSSTVSENELLVSEVEQRKISSDLMEAALPKAPDVARKRMRIETVSDEVSGAACILMKMAYSGQNADLGKLVRNPSFDYDDHEDEDVEDEDEYEDEDVEDEDVEDQDQDEDDDDDDDEDDDDDDDESLGQLRAEVKEKKRKREKEMVSRQLKLDFDLNQPYVDGEGTLDQN